ncbi:conserved hypothetical protein [Trichophyton verrucosum HKI 0517]|uniref:Mucin-7 n=1 Tax=Trichophyton verrucosum (strain HKI 0517) TaxID=663202 RepID=D4D3K4_TRIVH|nr:uncharacterized protein TRV_01664 [Trichophyton verrucosum HKI 0517]EFE43554.1 conserved hypothetical protein [Trichophyton verrucosum HKI 0517]
MNRWGETRRDEGLKQAMTVCLFTVTRLYEGRRRRRRRRDELEQYFMIKQGRLFPCFVAGSDPVDSSLTSGQTRDTSAVSYSWTVLYTGFLRCWASRLIPVSLTFNSALSSFLHPEKKKTSLWAPNDGVSSLLERREIILLHTAARSLARHASCLHLDIILESPYKINILVKIRDRDRHSFLEPPGTKEEKKRKTAREGGKKGVEVQVTSDILEPLSSLSRSLALCSLPLPLSLSLSSALFAMSAPTGVRGLLAKFENNNVSNISTSPPSRGRSPAGSDHSAAGRPLSKVRASFVAVERNIPGTSGSPILGLKRVGEAGESFGAPPRSVTDEMGSPIDRNTTRTPVDSTSPRKWGTPQQQQQQQNSLDGVVSPRKISDPIVSNVELDKTTAAAVDGKSKAGLGAILKGSPFEDTSAPPSPAKSRQTGKQANKTDDKPNGKTKTATPTTASATSKTGSRLANSSSSADSKSKATPRQSVAGSKPSSAPKSAKSPAVPGTTAKETAQSQTISATKKLNKVLQEPAGKTHTTSTTSTTNNNNNAAAKLKPAASTHKNGDPKSPTRPTRAHGSMLAPTAASTAKAPNSSPSRPSSRTSVPANTTKAQALSRKPSSLRSSAPRTTGSSKPSAPSATTTTTTTTVRKQGSRASLAPQHSSSAHDRPTSRASVPSSRPVDDSSLARLIRPTASSASKRQEKLDIASPPRLAANKAHTTKKPTAEKTNTTTTAAAHTGSPARTKSTKSSVRPSAAPEVAPPKPAAAEPVPVKEEKPVEPVKDEKDSPAPALAEDEVEVHSLPVVEETEPEAAKAAEVVEEKPAEVQTEAKQEEAKPKEPQAEPQPEAQDEVKTENTTSTEPQSKETEAVKTEPEEPKPEETEPQEPKSEESKKDQPNPVESEPEQIPAKNVEPTAIEA